MYDEWKVPGFIDWTLWRWGKRIWTRSLDQFPAFVRCDEDLDCFGPDGEAHKSLLYYEIDYPNLTTRIDARQSVVTSRWKEALRTGDDFGPYMESLQWLAKEIFAVCEVIDKRMLIGSDTSQGGKVDMRLRARLSVVRSPFSQLERFKMHLPHGETKFRV